MSEPNKYELVINIQIRDKQGWGGNFQLSETMTLDTSDMLEMFGILAEFDTLAKKFKESQK